MTYHILKRQTKVRTTDVLEVCADHYLEAGAQCVVIGDAADPDAEGRVVETYTEDNKLRPVAIKYHVTDHFVLHLWCNRQQLTEITS